MSDCVTIRAPDRGAVLEISATAFPDVIHVRLRDFTFQGATDVNLFESPADLAQFFRDLAAGWKGWNGEKRWESYEAELLLRATADSTGHVSLAIRLRGDSWPYWQLEGTLVLEAGRLRASQQMWSDLWRIAQWPNQSMKPTPKAFASRRSPITK